MDLIQLTTFLWVWVVYQACHLYETIKILSLLENIHFDCTYFLYANIFIFFFLIFAFEIVLWETYYYDRSFLNMESALLKTCLYVENL